MTNIELLELDLKNFKGIRELHLSPKGQDLQIYGENGTGKTTLADAWHWLLFDKDSQGNSPQSFDLKTLDESGEAIHMLENEVSAVIKIDEKELELKKIYQEKWQKQRGSTEQKFTGHTTDYFINEVPVKKSEYDDRIAEIIDEDKFRMLTNPHYFNEELHWKERREILMEVAGDITKKEIVAEDKELSEIVEVLNKKDRSLEEHRKVINSKLTDINKQIEKIPVRIDEVSNNTSDVSELNESQIQQNIEQLKEQKKEKEQELSRIENGGEIAEKRKRISEIETELIQLKNEHNSDRLEQIQELKQELSENQSRVQELIDKKSKLMKQQKKKRQQIEELKQENQQLREEWGELDKEADELREKEWNGEEKCPTCGQELPQEKIEEAKKKFHKDKSERLEEIPENKKDINQEGKANAKKIESLENEIEELQGQIEDLNEEKGVAQPKIHKLNRKIEELENKADQEPESPEYSAKKAEKKQLQNQIKQLQSDDRSAKDEIKVEIRELENKIETEKDKLQEIKQHKKSQERIEELKQEEEKLATKYDELERQLHLTEEYITTKVELLEEKINSKFELAEFKLFEEQVNGGLKQTCETKFDGVPYSSGLNTGARTNVGLDVIQTLHEHYGLRAPIFVDNAESVTDFIEIDAQTVQLRASENHQELTIIPESEFVNDDYGVNKLRKLASALNVRNYSDYKKKELIQMVNRKIILNGGQPDLEEVA